MHYTGYGSGMPSLALAVVIGSRRPPSGKDWSVAYLPIWGGSIEDASGGGGWVPAHSGAPPRGGPKMAQMAGAVGNFLNRFDTTTEEKREKCLPSAGPPGGPKKSGCLGTAGTPGGLKKKPGMHFKSCKLKEGFSENTCLDLCVALLCHNTAVLTAMCCFWVLVFPKTRGATRAHPAE